MAWGEGKGGQCPSPGLKRGKGVNKETEQRRRRKKKELKQKRMNGAPLCGKRKKQ